MAIAASGAGTAIGTVHEAMEVLARQVAVVTQSLVYSATRARAHALVRPPTQHRFPLPQVRGLVVVTVGQAGALARRTESNTRADTSADTSADTRAGTADGSRGGPETVRQSAAPWPAEQVEVIDPVGAGDAFNSGFLYAYTRALRENAASDSSRSRRVSGDSGNPSYALSTRQL